MKRARSPQAEAEAECLFCSAAPITTRFMPCGHAQACDTCARTLLDQKGLDHEPCPLCRQPIAAVEAVVSAAATAAAAEGTEDAWPKRARLQTLDDAGNVSSIVRFVRFPSPHVPCGPLAALQATAAAKCFRGDATPVALRFHDVETGMAAIVDDDDTLRLVVELWRVSPGRLVPTLQVQRAPRAPLADPASAVDFPVGTVVALAAGYDAAGDALSGPLRPGDRGVLVTSDGTATPYNVAFEGRSFWYKRLAVCRAGDATEAPRVTDAPPRTTPFTHPAHAHALAWAPAPTACSLCHAACAAGAMACASAAGASAAGASACASACASAAGASAAGASACASACAFACCAACRDRAEARAAKLVAPAAPGLAALYVGDTVGRGPQWKWGDQDGGGLGTVVGRSDDGWIDVRWTATRCTNNYRYARDARDLTLTVAPPPVPPAFAVGARVVLAAGFDAVADAARGGLAPGAVGTVTAIRNHVNLGPAHSDVTAFLVGAWWYAASALAPEGAHTAAPADLAPGASVVLRAGYGAAARTRGPMRPGDVGTLVDVDRTNATPYRVRIRRSEGWYARRAVGLPGCADAATEVEAPAPAPALARVPVSVVLRPSVFGMEIVHRLMHVLRSNAASQ